MHGSYHLTGIMETASGFELYPDGNFDFYYSYGAIDRHGYGTWKQEGDTILLHSDYSDKQGFAIAESHEAEHPFLLVTLQQPDPFFSQYMRVFAINGDLTEEKTADSHGRIKFDQQSAEKLMVMNDLFPDNIVTLVPENSRANHIVLSFNQDLALVHFSALHCPIAGDGFMAPVPLFEMMYGRRNFQFIKQA